MSSNIFANVVIQGSITALGTYGQTTYAPVDLGVNSLSLATGNLTSLITTSSSAPTGFAAAGEGALVFPGTANAYISFGTTGQPFSNSNIYAFGDFVVEAWVNPSSFTVYPSIIACTDTSLNNPYWAIYIDTVGRPNWFSIWNNISTSMTSTGALSTGTWQHVSVIYQGSSKRVQIYINGQPQTLGFSGSGATASGTVGTWTSGGGIVPVSNQPLLMGQYGTQTFTGSLTNLRITTGSGAAQIYNNNAFTPSTSPLFPASNTAGGSLTTRLLVRAPLTKGQTNISKIGPASGVLAFPPAPMTSYATNMTGQSYYGQGTYVASASSEAAAATTQAWKAFERGTFVGNYPFWQCVGGYSGSTGAYNYVGSNVSVDVTGTSYAGEWLQIQMPSSILLSNYVLSSDGTSSPVKWWILGSRDGTSWSLVDSRSTTALTSSTPQTFSPSASQAFTYFRMVIGISYNSAVPAVYEWTLNGSIEGVNINPDGRVGLGVVNPTRALEVAGDSVVNGQANMTNLVVGSTNPLVPASQYYTQGTGAPTTGSATVKTLNYYSPGAFGLPSTMGNIPFSIDMISLTMANSMAATHKPFGTQQVGSLDLASVNASLKGFIGGFTDGRYGYFVPNYNGAYSGLVARVDLQNFATGGVTTLDLASVNASLKGFQGGFTDGRYGYFVPQYNGAYSGLVARVDLQNFATGGVTSLDLASVNASLKGFQGGFTDGRYGYFVPNYNGAYSGLVARVDLQNFATGGVTSLDLTSVNASLKGFIGGFTDGRYGYFVPYYNGAAYSGLVARVQITVPPYLYNGSI